MTPLFISIKDAASLLGVSPWTVRGYVNAGVLRRANLPGKNGKGKLDKILIPQAEVDRLINRATETRGISAERGPRLPKGPSVVDQILTEWAGSLRVQQKPKQKGRR